MRGRGGRQQSLSSSADAASSSSSSPARASPPSQSASSPFSAAVNSLPSSSRRPDRPLLSPVKAPPPSSGSPSADSDAVRSPASVSLQHLVSYPIHFLPFVPAASVPPSPSSSGSESSLLRCIAADLSLLLSLPSLPFLSHCCLNTELQLLLRCLLHHLRTQRPGAPPHRLIAERVFLVLHRLTSVSLAEPPAHRPQLPASLCALPVVLDVAACYALHNGDAAAAIVTRLLSSSPSLPLLLPPLAQTVTASLSSLLEQLSLPAPLAFLASSIAFLSDSYTALYSLLLCSPSFASTLQAAGWTAASVRLYVRLCLLLRDGRGDLDAMRQLRRLVMSALHCLLSALYVRPLMQEDGDVVATAAGLLETLSDAASASPLFLSHYSHLHRLPAVLHALAAVRAVSSALGPQRVSALLALLPSTPLPSPVSAPSASLLRGSSSQRREDQQVEELRSLLDGELSADFARACLREYNGELSAAVQAVFDDALPGRLQRVERSRRRDWTEEGAAGDDAVDSGDMLGDERSDEEDAFRAYLLRTGRVGREEQAALTRSSLSVFEDRSDVDVLRQRIIASSAQELYDDEADDDDDDYAQLLSFRPDETPLDIESGDRPHSSRGAGRAAAASTGDSRDRWRREEEEREARREAETLKRIEAIAPSRRSEEEKAEWQRLTAASQQRQTAASQQQQQQQQTGAEQSGRGGRGMRGRSASRGRSGAASASRSSLADGGESAPASASASVGGLAGRRGRGGQAALSSEEREQLRAQRHQQSALDKQKARHRMLDSGGDDEQDEDSGAPAAGDADDAAAAQRARTLRGDDDGQLSAEAGRGRGAGGRGRGSGSGQRGRRAHDGRAAGHNRKAPWPSRS